MMGECSIAEGMRFFGRTERGGERFVVVQDDGSCEGEWNDYVSRAAGAELYHDARWRKLVETLFGHDTVYLLAKSAEGRPCGVLPLVHLRSRMFGSFLVSLPYVNYGGLVADSAAAADALLAEAVRQARERGATHIELRHRERAECEWHAREDKVGMYLELPPSEEALWKGFPPKLRAQIRRPQKAGATVRQGGAELVNDFYCVFARNMRDLGTPVYPKRFFSAVVEMFREQAKIFIVDLERRPVAAGLVLAHRDTIEIPWASSLRAVNRTSANMLLYWSVLADAVARGFRRFDFGRSTKNSGTYRFKSQWGAKPSPLRWHYWLAKHGPLPRLSPDNPKYRTAIALWRRLPVPVTTLLGPHIVKNLP